MCEQNCDFPVFNDISLDSESGENEMDKIRFFGTPILAFLCLVCLFGCAGPAPQSSEDSALAGEYFGQSPPGMTAELFSEGVLSTGMGELNAVFFPGGKKVIYSVSVGPMQWALVIVKEVNGRWTEPEVAPFSGKYGGVDPCVSQDGNTVIFCSNRPRDGESEPEQDFDLWYVRSTDSGWSEPVNMGPPVNTDTHEFYPSLSQNGTLYFQSRRPGGLGGADIYRTRLEEGNYLHVEPLPKPINSPAFEGDAFIAPDESYIIVSTTRAENIGQSDLYISFLKEDSTWTDMLNMGPHINSRFGENCQILSPCGRYLFFTSRRYKDMPEGIPQTYAGIRSYWSSPQNGLGDAYWVDAAVIKALRTSALDLE
jgi:hypothetical protein